MDQTGFTFQLKGIVQEKMDFVGSDGKAVRIFKVMWMGGSRGFSCESAEMLNSLPPKGAFVAVNGLLEIDGKGRAKTTLDRVVELDTSTGKPKAKAA